MKRISCLAIIAIALFTSCDPIVSIFNPLIGTWEVKILGVTTTDVFHGDGSCTETITVLEVGKTEKGTWTSEDGRFTRTWSDDSKDKYYYSFNSDKSEMTVSQTEDGLSVTMERQ